MAERNIPAQKVFVCDGCKAEVEERMPSDWTKLHVKANALDFQGCAVADASISRDLCPKCTRVVHKAINDSMAALASHRGEAK
ncbi:hypothetical protein [Qipengyuania sp. MTN3-11]|uniref:hypothetical protein n=1 Tax=Qipengyuania sp. MTN3-11 TaxID=3056557 RepID=UPI0036F2928F